MTRIIFAMVALAAAASANIVVPVAPVVEAVNSRSQYHAQNGFGEYVYGYVEPNGAKEERKLIDGTVLGSFSYASPDGGIITNNYVADEHGFRSNLSPTLHKDNAYAAAGVVERHLPAPHHHHHHHGVVPHAVAAHHHGVVQHAAAPLVHHEAVAVAAHHHGVVQHAAAPLVHHEAVAVAPHGASIIPQHPVDHAAVIVSTTPAYAYEKTVHSPNPKAHVEEQHFYKPGVVHKHEFVGPHGHVEKTYAEAGVSVKKTIVDEHPTRISETSYHEKHGQHAQFVQETLIDPRPVVTVEKQVHPLPVVEEHYEHAPVVQVHKPLVTVHKKIHHAGIPVIQAYVEPQIVKHVHHEKVVEVPVYHPRPEPQYYKVVPSKTYGYPRAAKKAAYSHSTYHGHPRSSSHVSVRQYFPKRRHGYGRHYGYSSYKPSYRRRSYGYSSRRHH